ncbi:MAG: hypothetical protein A3G34_08675 [Candidatus Lindowbacteria bacterium RIFCSPLOWO2_12_FULL_62_27]|nr:MAG: hypothetical protein A3G34_08675 [Candidatus Lindowbacteria bacterium RIFCSPLOWO2_12_FULL_62_27]
MISTLAALILACSAAFEANAGMIEPSPAPRPAWIDAAPMPTAEYQFFVGQSEPMLSEIEARTAAARNAVHQIADYVGVQINLVTRETRNRNSPAEIGHVHVEGASVAVTLSDAFISKLRYRNWRSEQARDEKSGRTVWTAWVLTEVPRAELERAIQTIQARREHARSRFGLYGNGAIVYQADPSMPYFTAVRNHLERHLSKFEIVILSRQPDSGPAIPVLNVSGRVTVEKTIYDNQFIAAQLVLRIQHNLPDGTTVTDHVISGTRRAYANTIETALETAIDLFLQDFGPELLSAIRG